MPVPTLPGITPQMITTARISTRVLFSGPENGIPVVFVHGNHSSATYWEETMLALPEEYRGIAADNRGYGDADRSQKIDATRGMGDLSDDLAALLDALNIQKAHVVGHSLGGSVLWRFMIDHPDRILTVTQVAPGSPFGFGGTKGETGEPCYPDYAGSGFANPAFAALVAAQDRSSDNQLSPRVVMNAFYWKPPFKPAREEDLLSSMLSIHSDAPDYPGDTLPSANFPGVTAGVKGPNNAISGKYQGDISRLYQIEPKPPVLWIRGVDDQIVGDNSLFDLGTLGSMGAIPGYPGVDVFPPQPMVGQTRYVLTQYAQHGGSFEEVAMPDVGHTPYIEKPEEFNRALHAHLSRVAVG